MNIKIRCFVADNAYFASQTMDQLPK